MQSEELEAIFDRQAAGYDQQWARMAPVRSALHFLLDAVFADFAADARILCVGVGTGAEVDHLARAFPGWTFTVVEPSGAMLAICRQRAQIEGYASRCHFHEGYLDSLPAEAAFDGATCFLVSQFIVAQEARSAFFRAIAERLGSRGLLASADLSADRDLPGYDALLRIWLRVMSPAPIQSETLERTRVAYATDVAVLPPQRIAAIIESGGFEPPVPFFQAGLMHAWLSRRAS